MQTVKVTTAQNIDIDYELAGLGERMVATLIDYGIFIFILILALISSVSIDSKQTFYVVLVVVYLVIFVFYNMACEIFMNGQSIGKRIMKIKVISLNGGQPTLGQYLLRWLFRIADFWLSSFLCALVSVAVSDKSQRLGDIVAGTTLIKTNPRTQINNVAFMPESDGYEPIFKEALQLNDKDVELIHEVIQTYIKTRNSVIVYNLAQRIKTHLSVTLPEGMNDMVFLQTITKDYNYLVAHEINL